MARANEWVPATGQFLRRSGWRACVGRQRLAGPRARSANHQADTLGEFVFVPPFSLPVRLFVEAKFRQETTGIEAVRDAFGVVCDVNENYVQHGPASRPRRRHRYVYTLFSTSGFSAPAQEYAIAHQISLVDLSGDGFEWLRSAASAAARPLPSPTWSSSWMAAGAQR